MDEHKIKKFVHERMNNLVKGGLQLLKLVQNLVRLFFDFKACLEFGSEQRKSSKLPPPSLQLFTSF